MDKADDRGRRHRMRRHLGRSQNYSMSDMVNYQACEAVRSKSRRLVYFC